MNTANGMTGKFTFLHGIIVGILTIVIVAILWPVNTISRRSVRTTCLSHLKQLGIAQWIYSSDHNDNLSPFYTFGGTAAQSQLTAALLPYAKNPSIYLCSESAASRADSRNAKNLIDFEHYPLILKYRQERGIISLSKMPTPDKTTYMREPFVKITRTPSGDEVETNHKKNPNTLTVLFVDSHVKFVPTTSLDVNGVWLR
jgi:hypothetical protein